LYDGKQSVPFGGRVEEAASLATRDYGPIAPPVSRLALHRTRLHGCILEANSRQSTVYVDNFVGKRHLTRAKPHQLWAGHRLLNV
jgi:hypothetical protein